MRCPRIRSRKNELQLLGAFDDGKRRGRCPYEHLGLKLPSYDLWELLQRSTDDLKLPEEVSTSELAA